MRKKIPVFIVLSLVLIGVLSNSCKKDNQGTITTILTAGNWQLSNILVTTTTNLVTVTDTINATCGLTQLLTFNTGNTCTYTNYDCQTQTVSGHWSLSADQLTLSSDMTFKFTTLSLSANPFANAQVFNAGQYSLVLQTGNYNVIPTTTNSVTVVRYGFIRQKAPIK
jgi:hypothetical protein